MADNTAVAREILNQIGSKALYMIGVKTPSAIIESGVRIKVGAGAKHHHGGKVTHLEVTLAADDTYTFKALRVRGGKNPSVKTLSETPGVYAEMLCAMIRETTGFATSL